MAIDVDWAGADLNPYRIFIPKADMPIIQASPEIRELALDDFRLALRDIEATVEGAPWPETHTYRPPSTLSGTTFARQVRILAPYTVEFEDGLYSVSITGGNHNIGDVNVKNSVSLIIVLSGGAIEVATPETQKIRDMWQLAGLDPANPAQMGPTQRTAGSITLTFTPSGDDIIVTRS